VLTTTVNNDWRGYVLTALTMVVVLRNRFNPLWLIAAGAGIGLTGIL
jgi:hypothetical protein